MARGGDGQSSDINQTLGTLGDDRAVVSSGAPHAPSPTNCPSTARTGSAIRGGSVLALVPSAGGESPEGCQGARGIADHFQGHRRRPDIVIQAVRGLAGYPAG